MDDTYQLINASPSPKDYRRLRVESGISAKSLEAAQLGLPNTWFGVHIIWGEETVAMGRIIGDGGCFFQVVDICVSPLHQRKGLGKRIVSALMNHFRAHAPDSAYISLIADGGAKHLYAQYGFEPTAPRSIGMFFHKV